MESKLENLHVVTDEMLGGMKADDAMYWRIRHQAAERQAVNRRPVYRKGAVYALAAMILVMVAVVPLVLNRKPSVTKIPEIQTIAAGGPDETISPEENGVVSELTATLITNISEGNTLFEEIGEEYPVIVRDGRVYRMLKKTAGFPTGGKGNELYEISLFTEYPSMEIAMEQTGAYSNVASVGAKVYAAEGLSDLMVVIAEVNGEDRAFERISYCGLGPGGLGLEDVLDIRDKVTSISLEGHRTLEGEEAQKAIQTLLDEAILQDEDPEPGSQGLRITLSDGLTLQLTCSGTQIIGCGAWSCSPFFALVR